MNWKQQWMNEVLSEIPAGGYRRRMEMELCDHLETQCRSLMEAGRTRDEAQAEALHVMGEPEALKREYKAAWRRSLPGRLEALRYQLGAWAGGCAVMLGVHLLVSYAIGLVWQTALSLPGDSQDPWVRMIRGTVGNLNDSWLRYLLPLTLALAAGAYYLSRKFQASHRPAGLISVGLSFHWAFIFAFEVWWEALDDHRTFWEELRGYLTYGPSIRYRFLTLALCVLLGLIFGRMSAREYRRTAA